MNGEILYAASERALGLVFFALMLTASEAGFRFGRRRGKQTSEDTKSEISTVEAGILGVLGLLLGFTMSMAVTRFEVRKQLVLEEANAIGTAHLRTQLLPATEGKEIADLLRAYANIRAHRKMAVISTNRSQPRGKNRPACRMRSGSAPSPTRRKIPTPSEQDCCCSR